MEFLKQAITHPILEYKMANGNILMMIKYLILILNSLVKNVLVDQMTILLAKIHKK